MKPHGQCPAPLGSHLTVVRSVSSTVMMLTYLCIHHLLDETTWTVSSSTGQSFDCGAVSLLSCDDVDLLVYPSSFGCNHVDSVQLHGQLFDCGEVSFLSCDDVDLPLYPSSFGCNHVDSVQLHWAVV